MTEHLDDVWTTRDYPVLKEVTRRIDLNGDAVTHDEVASALAISEDEVFRAARALERRGFVRIEAAWADPAVWFTDVSGAAYLVTGLHPDSDDAVSGLIELLRQAADQEPDEEERTRLRRAADGLLNVSRDVMVGVMTAYATRYGVH